MTAVIHLDGIDYYPVPGYAPLAISRCGACINATTLKHKKWTKTKNHGVMHAVTHVPREGYAFCLTLQRALALCFIPVPQEMQSIPIKDLRAYNRNRVHSFDQALDVSSIYWDLKKRTAIVLTHTQTRAVRVCNDYMEAKEVLSESVQTITNLHRMHGSSFTHKAHHVRILYRQFQQP
jgi:hypothetical protein